MRRDYPLAVNETQAAKVPGTHLQFMTRTLKFSFLNGVFYILVMVRETQLRRVDPNTFAAQTLVSRVGRKDKSGPCAEASLHRAPARPGRTSPLCRRTWPGEPRKPPVTRMCHLAAVCPTGTP